MKVGIILITAALCLSGCANKPEYKETDYPLLEEQDTPFIFKQAYQHKGAVLTQKVMPVESDFVVIRESDEYVYWKPITQHASIIEDDIDKTSKNEVESQTIQEQISNSVEREKGDGDLVINAVADSTENNVVGCAKILCIDGSHCGNIAKCGDTPCDDTYGDDYECSDADCDAFKVDYESVAKASPDCVRYPHLFDCPTFTSCKEKV